MKNKWFTALPIAILSLLDPMVSAEEESAGQKIQSAEQIAILAGGCFWGMEEILRKLPGVAGVTAGYTGGKRDNPASGPVHGGISGHAEAVQVTFNPQQISYEELLTVFFRMHDPTTLNRQGNDRGVEYRSAIFYLDDKQLETAEKVRARVDASGKWKSPVVTEIARAGTFFPAEEYHQDYLQKHPGGYTCHFLRK